MHTTTQGVDMKKKNNSLNGTKHMIEELLQLPYFWLLTGLMFVIGLSYIYFSPNVSSASRSIAQEKGCKSKEI